MNHVSGKVASREGGMGACMLPQKIWNFDALKHHLYCSEETISVYIFAKCLFMSTWFACKYSILFYISCSVCLTTDTWNQTPDIRRLMPDVYGLTSYEIWLMSDIRRLTSDIRHQTTDLWCQTSDVCCLMSDVYSLMSDVRHLIFFVWCQILMFGVGCQTSHIRRLISDVRNLMSDTWCLSDLRRLMSDTWSKMSDLGRLISNV